MQYYLPPKKAKKALNDNLMVFFSLEGFTSNPLVFWEYVSKNTKYETAWVVPTEEMVTKLSEAGITCCCRNTAAMDKLLMRAKYIVMDGRWALHWHPVEGQVLVQLTTITHFSNDGLENPNYPKERNRMLRIRKCHSAYSGILTATSSFTRIHTSAMIGCDPRKVFVTGTPGTDAMFYSDGKEALASVFPELAGYDHLILFTPTAKNIADDFQAVSKGYVDNIFNMDDFSQEELEQFLEATNTAIVFKLHPIDERRFKDTGFPAPVPKHCYMFHSNTFFGKSLYHLFNAFDCMISDVSSTAFEYLLLDRPIVFLHNELDMQVSNNGGDVIEDESLIYPGPRIYAFKDMLDAITQALENPSQYAKEREKTRCFLHKYSDGKSSVRVLEQMESYDASAPLANIEYLVYTSRFSKEETSRFAKIKRRIIEFLFPPKSRRLAFAKKVYSALQSVIK